MYFSNELIIKFPVITCRPDTLDPALLRPGRLDRKVEFSLPELEVFTITTVVICDSYLCVGRPLYCGPLAYT